jgi:hypothetical protein
MKLQEKDITPKYVNDKLESMMYAVFDSLMQAEERLKNMEQQLFELKQNGSTQTK